MGLGSIFVPQVVYAFPRYLFIQPSGFQARREGKRRQILAADGTLPRHAFAAFILEGGAATGAAWDFRQLAKLAASQRAATGAARDFRQLAKLGASQRAATRRARDFPGRAAVETARIYAHVMKKPFRIVSRLERSEASL